MTKKLYSHTLLIPAMLIYIGLFIVPTIVSFFFSLTRWTLMDWEFIGLENYFTFFAESSLKIGIQNTFVYAVLTCVTKVVFGLMLGVFLTSSLKSKNFLRAVVFFPTILSTLAIGIVFSNLMHPTIGLINQALSVIGIKGPDWLGNTNIALLSVVFVDLWKGVGMATVIYIAGIMSIPKEYTEALQVDGGNAFDNFKHITLPLCRPAMNSVIILAFIGGLRSFDLVWAMTKGGPGFATDLMGSIIYKQYASGFYGLSTAGNIIMFAFVMVLVLPLNIFLSKKEAKLS